MPQEPKKKLHRLKRPSVQETPVKINLQLGGEIKNCSIWFILYYFIS